MRTVVDNREDIITCDRMLTAESLMTAEWKIVLSESSNFGFSLLSRGGKPVEGNSRSLLLPVAIFNCYTAGRHDENATNSGN